MRPVTRLDIEPIVGVTSRRIFSIRTWLAAAHSHHPCQMFLSARHFDALRGQLTPLQFQKQLRLIEARRLLLADGEVSTAAYAVGYESVPQFTREYGRMFGLPPARDMRAAKQRKQVA